jgi:hypothetical protein
MNFQRKIQQDCRQYKGAGREGTTCSEYKQKAKNERGCFSGNPTPSESMALCRSLYAKNISNRTLPNTWIKTWLYNEIIIKTASAHVWLIRMQANKYRRRHLFAMSRVQCLKQSEHAMMLQGCDRLSTSWLSLHPISQLEPWIQTDLLCSTLPRRWLKTIDAR